MIDDQRLGIEEILYGLQPVTWAWTEFCTVYSQ